MEDSWGMAVEVLSFAFTCFKLALALSPILVLASLFLFNRETEDAGRRRKPDFSLEPLE